MERATPCARRRVFRWDGHELDENTTPLEAGLGLFVALEKGDFTGRAVLAEQKIAGTAKNWPPSKWPDDPRRRVRTILSGAPAQNRERIGAVTSGTQSPTLGIGIGLGYVPPQFSAANTAIGVEIRGQQAPALIVPRPFYRKS